MTRKIKKIWQLVMLLAIDLAILILVSSLAAEAIHMGSSGERVAVMQQQLSSEGFFSGEISGIFCTKTEKAIKNFQKSSGLHCTGEADYKTLSELGISSRTADCFSAEVELLAACIQQSNCRTYAEMLEKGQEILDKTKAARTIGSYISEFYPDILRAGEPSAAAYAAALQAIREI